jgi:multidrug efflux system membrane fusion protein
MAKWIGVALVLLIIGAAGWWYLDHQSGASMTASEEVRGSGSGRGGGGGRRGRHRLGGPVAVTTVSVGRQDVPIHVEGIGTVQAYNTVTVRARVEGQLDKVIFTEGQDVKAGDALAQIDPRPYQARLSHAQGMMAKDEAQIANVRLDLQRSLKLGEYATQQNVDTQKALVRQLEASLQTAQANVDSAALELAYTTIKAPITGRVGVRLVDEGNMVRAADATGIVMITQLQPISVAFSLPQQHLTAINDAHAKTKVRVTAIDADGKTVLEEGELAVVDNRIDAQTGTIRLKATFTNLNRRLWPGQFVNVRVQLDTRKDGTVIPTTAVQRNDGGTFAYVVGPDDKAELRPIRVGQIEGQIALVESGLEVGEKVVINSQEQLRPGASVIPTEETGEAKSAAPISVGLGESSRAAPALPSRTEKSDDAKKPDEFGNRHRNRR